VWPAKTKYWSRLEHRHDAHRTQYPNSRFALDALSWMLADEGIIVG
jgi:hypothetical protein